MISIFDNNTLINTLYNNRLLLNKNLFYYKMSDNGTTGAN